MDYSVAGAGAVNCDVHHDFQYLQAGQYHFLHIGGNPHCSWLAPGSALQPYSPDCCGRANGECRMTNRYEVDEGALFTLDGERKYLVAGEAKRLLAAADRADRASRLFCRLLYFTGCRISEGLAITRRRLDAETDRVIFRTLKRRRPIYRAVPIPARFMRELLRYAEAIEPDDRLFPWCRQTGWRRVHALMRAAGIEGPQATPKGIRHRYACHGIGSGLPESLVGRLLGHANPKSTRVYTYVVGAEEQALAKRMWSGR